MAMKKKLSVREYVYVASMLFGMFFGAGNLIFPVAVGQEAGRNVWQAAAGLMITGVGLPLLGVAALGISRSKGLYDLSSKAGRPYGLFFTCLLYLTIGPFFAIPRCANMSFTVGLEQILPCAALYPAVFRVVFCGSAVLLAAAGKDIDLDRQDPQPDVSALPGRAGDGGANLARDADQAGGAGGRLCAAAFL